MNAEQYQRATHLFDAMCQIPIPDRELWLKGQVDDAIVLQLVRKLEEKDRQLGGSVDLSPDTAKDEDTDPVNPMRMKLGTIKENATKEDVTEPNFAVSPPLLADYVDLVEIGRGGAGTIFRGHQKSLNRTVAIKMIRGNTDLSHPHSFRFQLEAEAAARLNHHNIVPIYEIGGGEECQFFTMKLIEGVDLSKWLRSERSLRDKVEIVRKSAEAIHYAHQNGVLHRDVKPANILIDASNEPHVTDFGLAKYLSSNADLTLTGQIMGTPSYISPEQATGTASSTIATDVYGLGAVLYTCLTGKAPLVGENIFDTLKMVAEIEPHLPSKHHPGLDRDLDTICMKCLAKGPEQRYQSADELAQDLGRWLRDEPIRARPVSITERIIKWTRRNRSVAALVISMMAISLSAMIVIGWLATNYRDSLRDRKIANIVQEIRDADVTDLQFLQQELSTDWDAAQPRLAQYLERAVDGSPEKLNLALSLSTQDASQFAYVIDQLGQFSAAELQTAVEFMLPQVSRIAGALIEVFQRTTTTATPSAAESNQRVASAAALMMLKLDQVVWPSLAKSQDPTLKNSLIHGLARLEITPTVLIQRLRQEQDPSIRQSIIQVLASLKVTALSPSHRAELSELISQLYATDPDPGVHSAAWLTFRRWGETLPQPPAEANDAFPELSELATHVSSLREQIALISAEVPPDHERWIARLVEREYQPPQDYVVHYNFDNAENRYKEEVSGSGGRTIGPGEAKWVDGVAGRAIHVGDENTIEGETSYYPDVAQPFSMGAWIHREVNVDTDQYGTIFSRSVPGDAGFDLWIDDGALGMHLVSIGTGGWMIKVAGTHQLPTDQWIHVFATYDGSRKANGIQLYLNGRQAEKKVFESEISGPIDSIAPFCIGQRYDGGQGTSKDRFPFHGAIDDIRLFDRRLTDYEVHEIYGDSIAQISRLDRQERTAVQRELLEQHHQDNVITELRKELATSLASMQELTELSKRRWYTSQGGPTFAILSRPGINERLPYTLAISTCPITVKEFQAFDSKVRYDPSMAPSGSHPINSVSRHDASAYCNWLSQQDGIQPAEWCYERVNYEVIQDPNNLPAGKSHVAYLKEKTDSLELAGYRLPTLDEWHFACRAGTTTDFSFGSDVGLFPKYGWSKENTEGQSQAVGRLLPNDFGIFDMHGGLWEWTSQGARHDCRLVGGSIRESANQLKFNISHSRDQFSREPDKTFRVVRTIK